MQKQNKSIFKPLQWLDDNLVFLLAIFLLIFIPLYPKWPLFDILPGYIVRIRLEDFFVLITFLVFIIQVLRKKNKVFPNPLWVPFLIFVAIGFLSCLSAIFITRSIPFQLLHIGKLFLHYFRRLEYISLFFIFFSAIKNLKQVKQAVFVSGFVLLVVAIYGFGQKYLYWPVYSTMNREFSKGWRLVLTEHARVPSTFAGHYDLAAYLALFLVIFVSLAIYVKKTSWRLFFWLIFIFGFFTLILTASRTSFISYMVGTSLAIFLLSLREKKKYLWFISRLVPIAGFSLIVMFSFGDLSERFSNFLKLDLMRDYVSGVVRNKIFGIKENSFKYLTLNQDLGLVYSKSDAPPTVVSGQNKEDRALPGDVYQDIPNIVATDSAEATGSAVIKDNQKEASVPGYVQVKRNYSETAYVVGLSSAIRLDALWPMAIKGFLKNPLLGSGYSTLNKTSTTNFTEAESTDNDYLRNLGESGLLGTISFFGIIFLILKLSWQKLAKIKSPFLYSLTIGIIAGTIALLLNAFYIDVFEASKIAFVFWAMAGILMASLNFVTSKNE